MKEEEEEEDRQFTELQISGQEHCEELSVYGFMAPGYEWDSPYYFVNRLLIMLNACFDLLLPLNPPLLP